MVKTNALVGYYFRWILPRSTVRQFNRLHIPMARYRMKIPRTLVVKYAKKQMCDIFWGGPSNDRQRATHRLQSSSATLRMLA